MQSENHTENIIHRYQSTLRAALIIGLALLAAGLICQSSGLNILPNSKALTGLSFIPLAVAFSYYIRIRNIKKHPQEMKSIIIHESDERLIAIKNEAYANAFKALQKTVFLTYMGYTLMVPADIFESAGWWLITLLLFISFIFQVVFFRKAASKHHALDDYEA